MIVQHRQWALLVGLLLIAIVVTACEPYIPAGQPPASDSEATQEVRKFSSAQEITEYLKSSAVNSLSRGYSYAGGGAFSSMALRESMGAPLPASADVVSSSAYTSGSAYATEYSQTNVQVAGVDEPDFVKNDGRYIYTLVQDKLVIVGAFPADSAKVLSETKVNGTPTNMFVSEDRLVVFAQDYAQVFVIPEYGYSPMPSYAQRTHAFVFDISDRSRPALVRDYSLNGNYVAARMVDDYVYFIASEYIYYYGGIVEPPVMREGYSGISRRLPVYYFDNPEDSYNFNTIASFSIRGGGEFNAETYMMGQAGTIYVSRESIYLAYPKSFPYRYYAKYNEERFYTAVLPQLPADVQSEIQAIKADSQLDAYQKWEKISPVLEEMYNAMPEREKEALVREIQDSVEEYEAKQEEERRKTVIHKVRIGGGRIEYGTRGEVPGHLLNQFSMDESGGHFRVATTTNVWTARESVVYNNVYVLDGSLQISGKLEALAMGERIYATRFLGDRLYMVTFKRIDPLFVIDLSNPEKPEVLGELKIPGYSDYLHPYDENYLIGVGKETGSNEWGGVSVEGVKLALFDVSDVKNPKPVDTYEIGTSGTDSEALRDHKAFLFDKGKSLLVIPVTEVKGKPYFDEKLRYYRQRQWQGAYVFGVTPESGFTLKGTVTHGDEDEQQNYWYAYGSPNAVRRSLYMDDVLYTVSALKIKMNDLNDVSKELNRVMLPYKEPDYRYG